MKRMIVMSVLSAVLFSQRVFAGQIIAGTAEDKLFQQISAEMNPDAKLQMLIDFEKRFPESKILPDVFLMAVDLYRQKGDRVRVIEYGERTLKADGNNVTALMVLARNYALERKNVDRAVMLAEQAIELVGKMKTQPMPASYTQAEWEDYLQSMEASAKGILDYARAVKGH